MPEMKRFYSKDWLGNEVGYVALVPRTCTRCDSQIGEGCYQVYSVPGGGCCHGCRDQATEYEQWQLDRGQAGLV